MTIVCKLVYLVLVYNSGRWETYRVYVSAPPIYRSRCIGGFTVIY